MRSKFILVLYLLMYSFSFTQALGDIPIDVGIKKKSEEVIVSYGVKGGAYPVIIDYDELFEKKVVINKKSFKVYNYSILKNEKPKLQYEKKIEEDDYNEIKKIAYETITNSWSEGCSIRNDGYHRPGGDEKLRFIYSKLEVEGEYICLYGPTEILQYLNNKYDLNIEWSKKVIFYWWNIMILIFGKKRKLYKASEKRLVGTKWVRNPLLKEFPENNS